MVVDLNEMNLSLAGCGYLGIYHLGVASCFRRFAPQVLKNKISGASVGALVASAFLCDVPLEMCTHGVFDVVMRVRAGILGPITPDLDVMSMLYENMAAMLPEDAHLHCNGKLHVSVTRYDDCQNVLLNQFDSKEDLLQALMCSSFIPVYCGYQPPEFHGVAYVDGGYSNNSPRLNEHTVIVSPFNGTSEICPRDQSGDFKNFMMNNTSIFITLKNCRRLPRILFPGPPDMLTELCLRGYNDALMFLKDNGIVDSPSYITNISELPKEILNEVKNAEERLNQNLSYRLLQNRFMKILYYMNIPSILTAKVSYVLFTMVFRKLQNKASSCVGNVMNDLPHILKILMDHPKYFAYILWQFEPNDAEYYKNIAPIKNGRKPVNGVLQKEIESKLIDNEDVTPEDILRQLEPNDTDYRKEIEPIKNGKRTVNGVLQKEIEFKLADNKNVTSGDIQVNFKVNMLETVQEKSIQKNIEQFHSMDNNSKKCYFNNDIKLADFLQNSYISEKAQNQINEEDEKSKKTNFSTFMF